MNDKTLLEKLKDVGKYYGTYADFYSLCRDAAERIEEQYKEIETLEAQLKQNNTKHMEVLNKLRETNDKYNTAKQLNEIHGAVRKEMSNEESAWIYARDVGALYREAVAKIERLKAEVKEVSHANDGLIKRNLALLTENSRLAVELNNLAPASHSDKDVAIRDDELRDQFAIAAIKGILSVQGWHPEYIIPAGGGHVGGQRAADAVAEQAYVYADAMLKAREIK